jgi:hypothetical protein
MERSQYIECIEQVSASAFIQQKDAANVDSDVLNTESADGRESPGTRALPTCGSLKNSGMAPLRAESGQNGDSL